jgi:hypothetical protein
MWDDVMSRQEEYRAAKLAFLENFNIGETRDELMTVLHSACDNFREALLTYADTLDDRVATKRAFRARADGIRRFHFELTDDM